MHRVNLLRHYGVEPILVFDGGLLPMKGEQENKRARYAGIYFFLLVPLELVIHNHFSCFCLCHLIFLFAISSI